MALDNSDPSQHGFQQGSLIYNCEPSVRREIINAMYRIGDPHSYERFWNQILTGDEREQLGGSMESAFVDARSAINQLAMLRDWPPERAILEISYQLGGLLQPNYLFALSSLGYETPESARPELDIPTWNANTGELRFRGLLCKTINAEQATAIGPILDLFQSRKWPERIRGLAGDAHEKNRLDSQIRSLNTKLHYIRFGRRGDGIRWYSATS